jgi:serine/threonine protein kinase
MNEDIKAKNSSRDRTGSDVQETMLEPVYEHATVGLEADTSPLTQLQERATDSSPTVLAKQVNPPEVEKPRHEEPAIEAIMPSDSDIAPDPEVGDRIQDYELLELLGKGGAGSVFKARCIRNGAHVALKVLAAKKLLRTRVVKRFIDEAKAAETVHHDCLVRLLEFIEIQKPRRLAYAMEYVQGISLRAHLQKERALHLTEAIHIARKISHGVGALHAAGIIHRDLKPENIMIIPASEAGKNPAVKVLDFGVAKFLTGDGIQSEGPGTFVGTPRYMAPEQAAGGKVDARSDLFAIGVMLFEMITGSRPHEGDTLKSVVMAKLKGAPRIEVNPGREILPQELSDVVDSCLKLKPSERPNGTVDLDRVLASAYAVLSAVGPIRLVDDGNAEPYAKSDSNRLPPRDPAVALDDEGEKLSTYVIRGGGASDDFRRKQRPRSSKSKRRIAPIEKPRPRQAPNYADPPKSAMKPKIAPRIRRRRRPPIVVVLLGLAVMFGIGIYAIIDGGGVYDHQSVESAKPVVKTVVPKYPEPYDILLISEPGGARIMIEDRVVGQTPHRVRIPKGLESIGVTVFMDKYERKAIRLTREDGDEVTFKLEKALSEDKSVVPESADENDGETIDLTGLEFEE